VLIALAIIIFSLLLILSGMVANRPELFLLPGLFCIFWILFVNLYLMQL